MNPLLFVGLMTALSVIVCWSGAQLIRWTTDRARRRHAARRGGVLSDFSELREPE